MANSSIKLLKLLSKLDKKERTELGKWLHSPVHNNSKGVIKLYEGIKEATRRDKVKPVSRLDMLKYIDVLPRSAKEKDIQLSHEERLGQLIHKLTVQLKDYLIWKKVKSDDILANQQLMEAFLMRGMHDDIVPVIKQTKKKLNKLPYRDIYYSEQAFKLAEMNFYISIILYNRNAEMLTASIQDILDTLREYSLINMLRYLCAAINLEEILGIQFDYPLKEAIRKHLEVHPDRKQPSVGVYYRLLELLLDEQPESYQKLKVFLFKNLDVFEMGEVRQFFNYMTNFCSLMISNQNTEFIAEKHEIYEKGLELECWTKNMFFSEFQFVHIVRNALLLEGKREWTADFIVKYQSTLRPKVKDYVCSYCNALLAYYHQEFDAAMRHLPTQEVPKDFAYFLDIKILKIKIHYDSGDWEILPSGEYAMLNEAENIRQYVNRSSREIAQNIREQYINFVNIFRRIIKRKERLIYPGDTPVTQANLQALQKDLSDLKPLIERQWLEEKITEIIQEVK